MNTVSGVTQALLDYVITVLWGWTGIVLAIIGFVDLVERALDRKFTVSTRKKVSGLVSWSTL